MLHPDVPVMNSNLNEATRLVLLRQMKAAKARRVWIALDRASFFERGDHMERLGENLRFFEENGLKTGVWMQAFGFGDPLPHSACDFTRIRAVTGASPEIDALCPEDERFMAAYLDWVRDVAGLSPRLIMLDDDLCLSVRPGIGCFCDRHLALLRKETEDFEPARIFVGGKNRHRDAWYRVMGDSMRRFCAQVRAAVDTVDPTIRVGLCAGYTSWDMEGTDPMEMARILGGKTEPFFRFTAAPYWAAPRMQRFSGQRLSAVIENARNQKAWSEGQGVEFFAEADSYPRPCYHVPATVVENFDLAMHASGIRSLKYLFDYHSSPAYECGYLKQHVRNLPLYEKIEAAFAARTPVGVRVLRPPHRILDAHLPEPFAGEGHVMRSYFSVAAAMLATQGIPVSYGDAGECAAVFGDDAQYLGAIPEKTVVDLPAALLLQEKGIDVGIRKVAPAERPSHEILEGERVLLYGVSPMARFSSLELGEGARVLSRYNTGCVASYTYGNFLVLNFDSSTVGEDNALLISYARGAQLKQFFKNPYPTVLGTSELYTVCAEGEGGHAVLFQNLSMDPIFDFDILLPKRCRGFRAVGVEGEDRGDRIHVAGEVAPMGCFLLEVEYENGGV